MFDPSLMTSGVPLATADPKQFKSAFEILRSSSAGGSKAVGLAPFTAKGIPIATHPEIFLRCTFLLAALDRGEYSEFVHGEDIDLRLLELFASFPFRVVDAHQSGSFQLNSDELEKAVARLRRAL